MPFSAKQRFSSALSALSRGFAKLSPAMRSSPLLILAGFLLACVLIVRFTTLRPPPAGAAGAIRGVGSLGHGPPARPAPPPRPAYGGSPGDYARGYEGMSPTPGDFWRREADFRARNYTVRHGAPPAYAAPSRSPVGGGGVRVIDPYDPILPRPPLPGDSDPPAEVRPVAPGVSPPGRRSGGK